MAMNSIEFGGVKSSDFGIYVGGEGTFNAPQRAVETISIPGRNGDYILDKGHFENITVTYTAFNYEKDLEMFARNLNDFRNAMSAQRGYQRLTDSFNPTEYRMATLIEGLEINPIKYNTASEFEIKFYCKPQRYLMSGDEPISIESGDKVLNPTLFEAKPLLAVDGYGEINIGDAVIEIANSVIGSIAVAGAKSMSSSTNPHMGLFITFDDSLLNAGDVITAPSLTSVINLSLNSGYIVNSVSIGTVESGVSLTTNADGTVSTLKYAGTTFEYGTAANNVSSNSYSVDYSVQGEGGSSTSYVYHGMVYSYDGNNKLSIYGYLGAHPALYSFISKESVVSETTAYSSMSALLNPIYIDLDIGEAYGYASGVLTSLNNVVYLPAKLPTLSVGETEITYDNTITSLEVTPRWWRV